MPAPQKFSIGNAFKGMRAAFEEYRPLVIRVTILLAVLNALSNLLDLTGAAGFALALGGFVLLGAIYQGLITALVCLPGRPDGMGELWQAVRPVLGLLIWVTLIYSAVTVAGLFLLVIPGLIIFTIWSVAGQVVVVERRGVLASLGRSTELMRGNGPAVFGFLLLLGIITLSISLLVIVATRPLGDGVIGILITPFLTNCLSAPFYVLGVASLYNELRGRGVNPEPEVASPPDPGPDQQ